MNNLCIIPARGGSKRIPRKNIKEFCGKPIIAYSIETAIKSGLFGEIMVSTDDPEIAQIAQKYGANVPFMRSQETANDHATLAEVVDEVIQNYKGVGQEFELACCILPTAVLMQEESLHEGYQKMKSGSYDSVMSLVEYSYPIQRALKIQEGLVGFVNPEYAKTRSQDLEPRYHDAGQFYWFLAKQGLVNEYRGAVLLNELIVQDIDTQENWEMAEIKYKRINGEQI